MIRKSPAVIDSTTSRLASQLHALTSVRQKRGATGSFLPDARGKRAASQKEKMTKVKALLTYDQNSA